MDIRLPRLPGISEPIQINLALLFGQEPGLPFYYRKLAGNIPDVKTLRKLPADMNTLGYEKITVVLEDKKAFTNQLVELREELGSGQRHPDHEKKKMQENNLFKNHTMRGVLDDFDIIECFEAPGQRVNP